MVAGLSLTEEFLVLFNTLKQAAGDSPERVRVFYKESKPIRDAAAALQEFLARTDLERRAFHGRKIVLRLAAGFGAAWKEYQKNWRFEIVFPADILAQLIDLEIEKSDPTRARELNERLSREYWLEPAPAANAEPDGPDPDEDYEFDPLRHNGGAAFELGMEQLEIGAAHPIDEHGGNSCSLAIGAYDYLRETIGLDVREVFRRWRNVPVVFMPSHVSNGYGASDKGSLSHLLDDAVRAYVFGAPAAALTLCRAAFEMILKRHYGEGEWENPKKKLSEVVALAAKRSVLQPDEIAPLINRADGILHRYAQEAMLSAGDERTIIIFLATLKSLIERAPKP